MVKKGKEAGGIWKFEDPRRRSMVFAWRAGNDDWLTFIDIMSPDDHKGRTRISDFSSSTCSIVHRRHGFDAILPSGVTSFGFWIMQALFKNL